MKNTQKAFSMSHANGQICDRKSLHYISKHLISTHLKESMKMNLIVNANKIQRKIVTRMRLAYIIGSAKGDPQMNSSTYSSGQDVHLQKHTCILKI